MTTASAPPEETRQSARQGSLASGRLGTWDIVFFVISAAAPLTVILSGAVTSFRMGGIGAPGRSSSAPSC